MFANARCLDWRLGILAFVGEAIHTAGLNSRDALLIASALRPRTCFVCRQIVVRSTATTTAARRVPIGISVTICIPISIQPSSHFLLLLVVLCPGDPLELPPGRLADLQTLLCLLLLPTPEHS
eukprot:gnl/TRDRNA2_/TRDRNA2_172119_c0_seq8.p1 gnl/TRDRNA2_/TRDRNA2_172119_c0~~gnl/TRDRNA2_/TRDRNA2_172119_c0_seq8.p1  ORF type:complete len:123 (-),score=6.60 gnl/TRDRNA2_/TRDRNA2_172119_c0_seq8:154-522(-)